MFNTPISRTLFRSFVTSLVALPALLVAGIAGAAFDADTDNISDDADAFPCDANAASVVFAPAQGQSAMMLFEDQWPSWSDLDFNDAALTYNYIFQLAPDGRVRSIRANYNLLAIGGQFNNGLGLRLEGVPTSAVASIRETVGTGTPQVLQPRPTDTANLTIQLLSNMRSLFNNKAGVINSDPASAVDNGVPVEVEIVFSTPQAINTGLAPFDLYIFRSERTSLEIHRPEFSGTAEMDTTLFGQDNDGSTPSRHFVDRSGMPYALILPTLRPWSREGYAIHHLYPRIVQFAASGGTQAQDFFATGVDESFAFGAVPHQDGDRTESIWALPTQQPKFVGPDDIPVSTSCVNAWGLSVQFGTSRDTFSYDSVLDSNGDMIVTGYSTRSFTGSTNQGQQDIFVAKYNSAGVLQWSKQFGGAASETGRSIAVDSSRNIYVVGEVKSTALNGIATAGQSDAFLMKLDASGNVAWTQVLGGSGNDYGTGVAVSSDGTQVFVGGGSTSSNLPGATYPGNSPSSFLAKYNGSGARQWTQQYRTDPSDPANYSYSADIALDPSGNVVSVGTERRYNRSPNAADNQYIVKHNGSTGALMWTNHLGDYGYYQGSTDFRYGHALAVATDSTGAAYITGAWQAGSTVSSWDGWTRTAGDTSGNITLAKVDASGARVTTWNKSLGSTNNGVDYGQSVQVDSTGNVYLGGYTSGVLAGQTSQGGYDYFLARFNPDATQAWLTQNGTTSDDGGSSIMIGSSGLYVLGNTGNVGGVPSAYQNTYFGFIATHALATGVRGTFNLTVDSVGVSNSCQSILASSPTAASGVYTIDPDGTGTTYAPADTYCDMTGDGGGWTLGMRTATSGNTFGYENAIWTDSTLLNYGSNINPTYNQDAKFPAFLGVSGTQVRGCLLNTSGSGYGCKVYTFGGTRTLQNLFNAGQINIVDNAQTWHTVWGYNPASYGSVSTGINQMITYSSYGNWGRVRLGGVLLYSPCTFQYGLAVGIGLSEWRDHSGGAPISAGWLDTHNQYNRSTAATVWIR